MNYQIYVMFEEAEGDDDWKEASNGGDSEGFYLGKDVTSEEINEVMAGIMKLVEEFREKRGTKASLRQEDV